MKPILEFNEVSGQKIPIVLFQPMICGVGKGAHGQTVIYTPAGPFHVDCSIEEARDRIWPAEAYEPAGEPAGVPPNPPDPSKPDALEMLVEVLQGLKALLEAQQPKQPADAA